MDFLDLLHEVGKVAKPMHKDTLERISDVNILFKDTEYDSLDLIVVCMFMCQIYGINDDIAKKFHPKSPQELFNFIEKNKTKEPKSISEAIQEIL